uniref:Protein kinase domain-containing protein n=2 Tax=Brassica oleracea TaxID=3712 RepID=A0A0D3C544_BRAOL|nr:unnamed protein product [Brassica oleracea]
MFTLFLLLTGYAALCIALVFGVIIFYLCIKKRRAVKQNDIELIDWSWRVWSSLQRSLEGQDKDSCETRVSKSRQGLVEFKTEIETLSQFRHMHLVSLIGGLRCAGAARGLHYLHTGSTKAVIHRNVKSANILLDENFTAKVADFGLSRLVRILTRHIPWVAQPIDIPSYLDPEYLTRQQLTAKSDVYSFGVIDHSLPREKVNLIEWAMKNVKKGKVEEIMDPFLDQKKLL